MNVLHSIKSPLDLKNFTIEQLIDLAKSIREEIIDVMAVNGGHLGSNMGIVELSIALHKVFNSPLDKFIFDVSHQTYSHKILTGRLNQFSTIRQHKGLSGFSHPEESEHDHFFAGHAGTALSLALGVAKARDLQKEPFHILPIIGDATFTCGLSLEALNNIPADLKRFIIVLNDNNMSISNNVGAITKILNEKEKSSRPFFERYGLKYVGPIDGHNLEQLIEVLEGLKGCDKPILLHALTIKGKGLEVAEQNPIPWHGCSPFDKVTGKKLGSSASKPTFPQIFGSHLLSMAEKDPTIVTVTPAMPHGSCINTLMEKFPERCIDVGIAEGHAVTFSGGIASSGTQKVVCSIYSTFLQRAFDNLFQDVCLQNTPVVFALDRAGLATGDGATHHGIYDISFLNAMPNMVICQPRNGQVLRELLDSAFDWKLPTVIRYPNMATDDHAPLQKRVLGKGEYIRYGKDIALIALGHMKTIAEDVANHLQSEGISVSIIDPIFIKPLDAELLEHVFTHHEFIATIEEHAVNSGLGALINTFAIAKGFSSKKIRNFGIPDRFVHHGGHRQLLASIGLDPETISSQIIKELSLIC